MDVEEFNTFKIAQIYFFMLQLHNSSSTAH